MSWRIAFTKQAQKGDKKISASGLKSKAGELIQILRANPFQAPPPFVKLVGDVAGAYLRRINIQQRLVSQVLEDQKTVKILRMWTHYE